MVVKVRGGRIVSVAAKRLKTGATFEGLNVNIDILDVSERGDDVVIDYEYTIHYAKDLAEMKIIGEAWLEGPKTERKSVVDHFKKQKNLPTDVAERLLGSLEYTASSVGTLLGYAINVSAPIKVFQPHLQNPPQATQQAG